ncbi:MAG: TIGR04283 family arsenosugar biosynthesis glycosyltransferase [Gammaproteobacteria bacterium]|nr:TIGR04283 family arsenosugar biosynthesis glycosyltransferase [Gammaproteobacteria bacterium]
MAARSVTDSRLCPRISIIIPVLNEEDALRRHLPLPQGDLQAQGRYEVIVVDGGSRDGSRVACEGLVDHFITSAPGRARQMNAGAAVATGEILLFLHIDTLLPDDALTLIQQQFSRLTALWGRFDVRLSGTRPAFRCIEYFMNLRSRVSGVATGDQAIFVRRSVFERVGGFPDLPLMEDVALSKTLRRLVSPVCLRARVVTSSRRWEQHGVARTVLLMWWLRLLYVLGVAPAKLHARYYKKYHKKKIN